MATPPAMPDNAAHPIPLETDAPEVQIASEVVYAGSFLTMRRDAVRLENGVLATREYVQHPGAVMIIPIFEKGQQHVPVNDAESASTLYPTFPFTVPNSGRDLFQTMLSRHVLLEYQYRYPVQQHIIEFPAGKLDPNETSLACAKRELREETGYCAAQWYYLTRIYPSISYSTEWIDLYLAEGLTAGVAELDEEECLETASIPAAQLLEWVQCGKIKDVKTLIGAFWLEKILLGAWDKQPA